MGVIPKSILQCCWLALLVASPLARSQAVVQGITADDAEFFKKVRASYYSVRALGLKQFQCEALPDWAKYGRVSPEAAALLKQVDGIKYSVIVNVQNPPAVTVTPLRSNERKFDQQAESAIDAYRLAIKSFFENWLSSLLLIDELPNGRYHVSAKTDERYVVQSQSFELEFDHDYGLTKSTRLPLPPKFVILSTFTKTDKGLVLTKVENTSGGFSQLTSIQYANTAGFDLPIQVAVTNSKIPGFHIDVSFTGYHLN